MTELEAVYQSEGLNDTLSRADMWALLGIWAVQQTIDKSNEECEDCDTVPDLSTEFQCSGADRSQHLAGTRLD